MVCIMALHCQNFPSELSYMYQADQQDAFMSLDKSISK